MRDKNCRFASVRYVRNERLYWLTTSGNSNNVFRYTSPGGEEEDGNQQTTLCSQP
jgi:hypothetical protein